MSESVSSNFCAVRKEEASWELVGGTRLPGRARGRRRCSRSCASDGKAVDALRHTEINAQLTRNGRRYQRNNVLP
jgi:hypothetical protein